MSVDRRIGAGEREFEAYTHRQFVTESSYNNSLADHYKWSTIKTLPATLHEFSSRDRGYWSRFLIRFGLYYEGLWPGNVRQSSLHLTMTSI